MTLVDDQLGDLESLSEGEIDLKTAAAWWRQHPPYDISEHLDSLRYSLVEKTDGLVDGQLLNLVSLRGERAEAAFEIASQLVSARADSDLSWSWIALSGLFGDRCASKLLHDQLVHLALQQMDEENEALESHFHGLASDWDQLVPDLWKSGLAMILDTRSRALLHERLRVIIGDDRQPKKQQEMPLSPAAGEPHLIPVAKIGDAQSREGQEAASRYGALTKPFQLAGTTVCPDKLKAALMIEFPWMEPVISAVHDDLRLLRAAGVPWFRFRPLLVVGPPGIGKTRLAQRLGALAGTGWDMLSVAGAADNRVLAGTARGWTTGQPAWPLIVFLKTKTANPVLLLDEIDKAGGNRRNGDPRATLLSMLEPSTASAWPDEYLMAPTDLRQVSWLLTANTLEGVSEPLLSRVRVIHVNGPSVADFDALLEGILRDVAGELMVSPGMLPELEDEAVDLLREGFRKRASVRALKGAITAALSRSASLDHRLLH